MNVNTYMWCLKSFLETAEWWLKERREYDRARAEFEFWTTVSYMENGQ